MYLDSVLLVLSWMEKFRNGFVSVSSQNNFWSL